MSLNNPIIISFVILAMVLLIVGIVSSLRKKTEDATPTEQERVDAFIQSVDINEKKPSPFLEALNKRISKTTWGAKVTHDLARADIKLRPAEYIELVLLVAIAISFVAGLIGGFVWHVMLLGLIVGVVIPSIYLRSAQSRRLVKFENQLPDMINLMVNGLRAGYSNLQAMESISKELPSPICDEFRRVVQEVQLGIGIDRALGNLTKRIPSEDLDLVVTAMNIHREVGGNLSEILETISHTIRERVRIQGEIRVLTSQAMYSGKFLSLMPVALLGALYLVDRSYILEFLAPQNKPCGYIALGAAGLMILGGYLIMKKLAQVEV